MMRVDVRLAAAAAAFAASAVTFDAFAAESEAEMSSVSGPADSPRRHFRLRHAQDVGPERATGIYDIVAGALARGYGRSKLSTSEGYQQWARFSSAPYLSSSHGNHYLSNYANEKGLAYGRYEAAGVMPQGAVIAKDSFAVTSTGGILLGPLFLMEKMGPGFNPASGDWKYTQVQPDGEVLGETNGPNDERVEYCVSCHLAVEKQDHLFFLPEAFRVSRDD